MTHTSRAGEGGRGLEGARSTLASKQACFNRTDNEAACVPPGPGLCCGQGTWMPRAEGQLPKPTLSPCTGFGGHWQGNQFSSCSEPQMLQNKLATRIPWPAAVSHRAGGHREGQWPGEQEDDAALTEDIQDLGDKADMCDAMGEGPERGRRALATGRLSGEECCPPAGPPGWVPFPGLLSCRPPGSSGPFYTFKPEGYAFACEGCLSTVPHAEWLPQQPFLELQVQDQGASRVGPF